MEEHPSPASHGLMFDRFVMKPFQISTKEEPLNFRPKSPFTWVEATVKAAAEQKPEMTGAEMKSTMNPATRTPRPDTLQLLLMLSYFNIIK